MSSRTTIDPLSITDGKISNQAKINPKKVAPADEASFLITQNDRKYQPKKIHGDGTIDADGRLTISATTSTVITSSEEETLPVDSVKIGPSNYDATENRTKKVGVGPSAIPVRDTSGNLKAETADSADNADNATSADNADKLDDQEGTHYLDVTNHTAGTSTAVVGASGILNHTTQTVPTRVITAVSTGNCSDVTDFVVEHSLGTMPLDVKVFEGSSTTEEVEVEVESTATQSTVKFSPPGPSVDFTIKILGVKE